MTKPIASVLLAMSKVMPSTELALYAAVAVERFGPSVRKALIDSDAIDKQSLQQGEEELHVLRVQLPFRLARLSDEEFEDDLKSVVTDEKSFEILKKVAALRALDPTESETFDLALNLNGSNYSVHLPTPSGIGSVYEVLLARTYQHSYKKRLRFVYDLGAHIGLSAIYLHSLNPEARLICVEPSPANLVYLQDNLRRNQIDHEVFPGALGSGEATVSIRLDARPSMLNSTVFEFHPQNHTTVCAVRLDELPTLTPYGIKLDIEGAEYALEDSVDFLLGAEWIVGELHFGSFTKKSDRWLPDLLRESFVCRMSIPRVSLLGTNVIFARDFQAQRLKPEAEAGGLE